MKKLIFLLFLFAPLSIASSKVIKDVNVLAPMGLAWGMSLGDLERKKIRLSNCLSHYGSLSCEGNFEEGDPLNYAESYYFTFDLDGGLQYFSIQSHVFENDPSGKIAKKLYFLLKNSISKQYGEPGFSVEIDSDVNNEFYKDLENNFTHWNTYFVSMNVGEAIKFDSSSINIKIVRVTDTSGKVIIVYKSKDWEGVLRDVNKNRILQHIGV